MLKRVWMILATFIILAAICSSIFRSLTPWATQYKKEVEAHLSQIIGEPVSIQSMKTGWYWFQPVLKLEHLYAASGQESIHLEKLLIGINLFQSLIHWRIQPGILYIDNVRLTVRQKNEAWHVDGLPSRAMGQGESPSDLMAVLAHQERLMIQHVSVLFYFKEGTVIPLSNLNLSVMNRGGYYKVSAHAHLDQTSSAQFKLLGEGHFDPYYPSETKGHLYFSAKNVLLAQWQQLLNNTPARIEGGKGSVALWLDLNKGKVSSAQAQLSLKHIAWKMNKNTSPQWIQSFSANLMWTPHDNGWRMNADHIHLRMGNVSWPENQASLTFNQSENSYLFFAKTLLLDSLLTQARHTVLPEFLVASKAHGVLHELQLMIKSNQLSYLLTRFDNVGWAAQNHIPEVKNLSGVVHWEPHEGQLELDSQHALIQLKGYPEQELDLLNGVIDWKALANGFRISMDRLILSQPELTISAQGVVDDVSLSSLGHMRLNLDFSAKNIQQWIPYIPKQHLKPGFYLWLKDCLKQIAKATGKLRLDGYAKDFPFDNHQGEFSVIAHAQGGELFITPKWQLIKDIEGYIRLKNRNLDIDIVDGNAKGVPINKMNVRIDDIGKDKEVLFINALIEGRAQKMLQFVLASPLNKKLAKLKRLTLEGLLHLKLHLEIPLYPENDDNLVSGDLTLKDNRILISHQIGAVPIDNVSGILSFNESGMMHSALSATAFDYPLSIKIQTTTSLKPVTTVLVDGQCPIDALKKQWNHPLLSRLKGLFSGHAVFQFAANPKDWDHMMLHSNLQGLAINLPKPLGKTYKEEAPLKIHLDFNSAHSVRLRSDYHNRLSTDILFKPDDKDSLCLKSGQIQLGSAPALNQKTKGLSVAGSLNDFDLQEWSRVFSALTYDESPSSASMLSRVNSVNLLLNKLTLFDQRFDNLSIKGHVLPNNNWAFNLEQKKISADLTYAPRAHLLSGFIKRLHLDKIERARSSDKRPYQIKPEQIPHLNLRLDDVSVGRALLGDITLKSHSLPQRWLIDYCRIDTPVYQAFFSGEWLSNGTNNQTKMQAKIHLSHLAKSLERWNITPAVHAKQGDFEFRGGWRGGFSAFSLSGLRGDISLQLKNGRITHLSPETEEKLGLGKLLSILSLQTIPRRLKLDFSDLSHEGYSFDIFKGTFKLNKGIMTTQDSYLDGPVAYAAMRGDLDIVRHMYDLNLSISPHITASLPVVATIAGGPIVGLAAWVANKIINQSMQKIARYSYKISGPWDQPVVQQLSMVKKKMKK